MGYLSDKIYQAMCAVAQRAVTSYAQNLLTEEELIERMWQEWKMLYGVEEMPTSSALMRLAQRICSYELCQAWLSKDVVRCEHAYHNLWNYLKRSILQTSYGPQLQIQTSGIDDVLNNTLEILYSETLKKGQPGPDDPASFLKWVQTIGIRQARLFVQRLQHDNNLSLDTQKELFAEKLVDKEEHDPLRYIFLLELRQILGEVIMTMRNQRYRQILLYSYFAEFDEAELAQRLDVPVSDIYLWRHRALKALRKRPEILRILRVYLK